MTANVAPTSDEFDATDRRRNRERRRVLLAGRIVQADGVILKCAIRNLSDQGAQIRIEAAQALPDDFHLIELRSAVAHLAHVAWRRESIAGLVFWDRIELDDARANLMVRLRQAWRDGRACLPGSS